MTPPSPWIGSRITAQVSCPHGVVEGRPVAEGDVPEAGDEGLEVLAVLLLSRGRQGPDSPPVKGPQGRHDDVALRSRGVAGVDAGQLQGRLVGLGPAVAEEDPAAGEVLCKDFGEADLEGVQVEVGDVHEGPALLPDGLNDGPGCSGRGC